MKGEDQALIPGLPDDVALDCIARTPSLFHSQIRAVCRNWRDLVTAPSFLHHRERVGAAEDLIFLVQAMGQQPAKADPVAAGEPKEENPTHHRPPAYALAVYNATLATWHRLPTPDAIPMFSQIAAVDGKLILVGGWDPITFEPVTDVRILDLCTMTWRRGTPMASARSFFACAASGGKVYVGGGHDGQKNALRSAEAYDVASDEWVSLPPMREERDESRGLIVGGRFWSVSGYSTDEQGRFSTSAEMYDPDEDEWVAVEGAWDDAAGASCFGSGGMTWSVDWRGIREFDGKEWRVVGPAPEGVRSGSTWGAVIGNGKRVVVTGVDGNGLGMMDLKTRRWIRVESAVGFAGFVYSACAIRI